MATTVQNLFDANGEHFYPLTHVKAVVNDSGENVEQLLEAQNEKIGDWENSGNGSILDEIGEHYAEEGDSDYNKGLWGHMKNTRGRLSALEQKELVEKTDIVNDLTTGGANKALSAEMGKELSKIVFPFVTPVPLYEGDIYVRNYELLSKQFIKELYIYDVSNIQNEDITSVSLELIARNHNEYGWLIWFKGTNKSGTSSASFIRAKNGGKSFDESTEVIPLVYNDENKTPCGYIIVDWSFIEDGARLGGVFKWTLTERCLDITYSPIIRSYLEGNETNNRFSEINNNLNLLNNELNFTERTLVQNSILEKYVNANGLLSGGAGRFGSYVYDIEGISGRFKIESGIINDSYFSVCRVEDANGYRINKFPLQNTTIGNIQYLNITEKDKAKTLYVSVDMPNNVVTKPSSVVVEKTDFMDVKLDVEDIKERTTIYDKIRITENDKVTDQSITNPLKCFSTSANNFGSNNEYNYWYTLFKLPAHTKCVVYEKKNNMTAEVALVVKVDSLDQFRLNGSYTRLISGKDADTNNYDEYDVYQHEPIIFDEDTYLAVLSNSSTDYTRFCYLEFLEELNTSIQDINDRVLELEGARTEKPYEIVIPDTVYAVVGDTLQIFYDSIFNIQNLSNYQVQTLSSKGKAFTRYFEYTPSASDIGETTLTFNLCEVIDCTNGIAKVLTSKNVNLITVPALTDANSANVLCVGDSTTTNGYWPKELARRFYANDGVPQGLGLNNINICGRKTDVVANKTCGWEGTGGFRWSHYVSTPEKSVRFYVKDVNSLIMGANYVASNGVIFEIAEINVTNGVGNIRCMYSWDSPSKDEIPANGVLTKRYSSVAGDASITYTSCESEEFSPFYVNGEVDFTDYANRYCNGVIDIIVVHLGINNIIGQKTNLPSELTSIINTAKIFIDKFHEQFPNSKVLLVTPPKCSANGGMAANYNATQTTTEGTYNRQMFQYHKKYFELANQEEYKNWVVVVNTCGEFDTPYGYPYTDKAVNTRVSSITERVGTNGVHPNSAGYYMIADSVYRTLTGVLNG